MPDSNVYSEFITRYSLPIVDKAFALGSKTQWLENNKSGIQLDFAEVGYVKVADFLIDGLGDYKSADSIDSGVFDDHTGTHSTGYGWQTGHATINWTIYKLQWVRGKAFNIDRIEDEKSAKLAMGNAYAEFTRLHVVPEVDTCRLSELASKASASLGNLVSEASSGLANNMVEKILDAEMKLYNLGVEKQNAKLLLSTKAYNALRTDSKFVNYITQEDQVRGDRTFKVTKFDEMELIIVEDNRFYTNVVLDSYNGYHKGTNSKQINFMLVDERVGTAIRKLEQAQVYDSNSTHIGFNGWKLTYTLYHGLIVPKNKVPGLFVSVDTSISSIVNALFVNEVAGTGATGDYIVKAYYTNPQGLRGQLYVAPYNVSGSVDVVVGANVSSVATKSAIAIDEVVNDTTNAYAKFFIADGNGTILAVSEEITLDKKA